MSNGQTSKQNIKSKTTTRRTMNTVPKEIMELLHKVMDERTQLQKELKELKELMMKILEEEQNDRDRDTEKPNH